MARKILSSMTLALLLALTPSTARAQEDFGGGGGVDYSGGYDSYGGGYDTSSSGYDTQSYGYDNASAYDTSGSGGQDTSSSGYDTGSYGYDVMSGDPGNGAVLSSSSGYDTNDVAGGDPWSQPALATDPWTTGAAADPYASSTDPWVTTASNDPWAGSGLSSASADPWSTSTSSDPYTSSSDPWGSTSTSNDPWTSGAAPDPYASATDPWATTASNDPWAASASSEAATSANEGWTSSTSNPEGWSSSAPEGWSSASNESVQAAMSTAPREPTSPTMVRDPWGAYPTYIPSDQAQRVVERRGSASEEERLYLMHRFDEQPQGTRDRLDREGARIVTGRNLQDSYPQFFGGGRTEDGRTMQQVNGAFLQPTAADRNSRIMVGTEIGENGLPRLAPSGSADMFHHEVGHWLDYSRDRPSQGDTGFRAAVEADRAMVADPFYTRALDPYYSGYSSGNHMNPDRGASETFAESYAEYMTGNRSSWPSTYDWFSAQPWARR